MPRPTSEREPAAHRWDLKPCAWPGFKLPSKPTVCAGQTKATSQARPIPGCHPPMATGTSPRWPHELIGSCGRAFHSGQGRDADFAGQGPLPCHWLNQRRGSPLSTDQSKTTHTVAGCTADFNTQALTPAGNTHGMPVAMLCGYGPDELTGIGGTYPAIGPSVVRQIGIRNVDEGKKPLVRQSGHEVFNMRYIDEVGMRRTMEAARPIAKPSCAWK